MRCALELTRLETADGGGSNSFSSMLASLTKAHDVPSSTMLLSTFRVIILQNQNQKQNHNRSRCWRHKRCRDWSRRAVPAVDTHPR